MEIVQKTIFGIIFAVECYYEALGWPQTHSPYV